MDRRDSTNSNALFFVESRSHEHKNDKIEKVYT
jgi:hypothetical protein